MPKIYQITTEPLVSELVEKIKVKHLSAKEVADKIKVSRQRFYNYLFHKRMPTKVYTKALKFVNNFTV
jgi:mannosyltransferase OCH1-like enzyme